MDGEEDFSVGSEKNTRALPEDPNENIITKNNETQENDKKCESWIWFYEMCILSLQNSLNKMINI